jgi:hypothetical protein
VAVAHRAELQPAARPCCCLLQGNTQLWPHAGQYDNLEMTISDDVTNSGYSARVLLKFAALRDFMAASANIVSAKLTLTLHNWDEGVTSTPLQVNGSIV